MKLSEPLMDLADAEYFANHLQLLQVGYGRAVAAKEGDMLQHRYPTVTSWFESLGDEGKKQVVAYLHQRHGCYTKFF